MLPREGRNLCFFFTIFGQVGILKLMPRLHMQVCQPSTERKSCIKAFLCCQSRAIYSLWRG